jgi:hypothetical protein
MANWQQSLFTSYPNYGLRMNQPISTYFDCQWQQNPGFSSALSTYDFDVASYGFMGWAGETVKYVQLQMLGVDPQGTLTFKLTQSLINEVNTVPIPDLPSHPTPETFSVDAFTLGPQAIQITTTPTLTYQGDGVYSAKFDHTIDPTRGVAISLVVPHDKIWVSASLASDVVPPNGSVKTNPSLITIPPSTALVGVSFFDQATLLGATANAGGSVTYTLYSGMYPTGTQIGSPCTVDVINGQVPNSTTTTVSTPSAYYYLATYSGDTNNNAADGVAEPFTVGTLDPQPGKETPAVTTTPPGSKTGVPSQTISVTMPVYTQTSYSATIKDPTNPAYGALGIYSSGYWVGQIPLQIANSTNSYQALAYCMNFDKEANIGSTKSATLTTPPDNATWRAVSYILSWNTPTDDTAAAVEQVAFWRLLDANYHCPSWLSSSIDNQAINLVNQASGKDTARQGDTLKWISPLDGNMSSVSLAPGSTLSFTAQLTTSTGAPRANVQLQFTATLNYADSSIPLNSTYLSQASAFTDSQGKAQVDVVVPQDTPFGASILVQASSRSMWPQRYVNLNNADYQDFLVEGPILNVNLSANVAQTIDVNYAATTGTPFVDTAVLSGATSNAQGTVTYTLFSGVYPSGSPVGSSQVSVTNGIVPNSSSFTVNTAGSYYFVAIYSGDADNNPAVGEAEPFVVGANLMLTTTPPSNTIAGTPFFDQAILSGVTNDAGGTVTYMLYNGTYPAGAAVGTSTVTVSNGVVPNSAAFTVNSAGPYYFIAQYSGDDNNSPVNGGIEAFIVSAPPYSGMPFYFYGSGTQNPWLNSMPPTSSDKINSYISNGQPTATVQADISLSRDMVISDKVNVTLYLGTSQPIHRLNVDVGFYYQNHYYSLGTATIHDIPRNVANRPYQTTITVNISDQVLMQGYPPLTVPAGSTMSITTTAPNFNGRITLYYGPGQLSRICF